MYVQTTKCLTKFILYDVLKDNYILFQSQEVELLVNNVCLANITPPTGVFNVSKETIVSIIEPRTCDFQQCGILTSVDTDDPVQPTYKLRNSHKIFKQQARLCRLV